MNRLSNALVRSAAADVSAERVVNILVARRFVLRQQSRTDHDDSHLAITALRYLVFNPRHLQRMMPIRRKPFDRGDVVPRHRRDPRSARPHCLAIHVHRTSPAKRLPAAEFRPSQSQRVAQHPKQRRIRAYLHRMLFSIHSNRNGVHSVCPLVIFVRPSTFVRSLFAKLSRELYVQTAPNAIRLCLSHCPEVPASWCSHGQVVCREAIPTVLVSLHLSVA